MQTCNRVHDDLSPMKPEGFVYPHEEVRLVVFDVDVFDFVLVVVVVVFVVAVAASVVVVDFLLFVAPCWQASVGVGNFWPSRCAGREVSGTVICRPDRP